MHIISTFQLQRLMKLRTSTKVFCVAFLTSGVSFVFYLLARKVWNDDIERLKLSPFWGSTLDIGPYTNWAHYTSFAIFVLAVAIFIAGFALRRTEKAHRE